MTISWLEEAIAAATLNAAFSLDLHDDVGSLEPGMRADLVILRSARLLDLLRVGVGAVHTVVKDGRVVVEDGRRVEASSRVAPEIRMLAVQDLVKTYPGSRQTPPVEAVRGLSFEVHRGQFFGLLGPNGAGKSTTLGCITTLVVPTAGRILLDGVDVAADARGAKRRIGVVPQTRNLDRDLTVRECLTYHARYFGVPAADRDRRTDRLLEEMRIADKADAKPLTLSGGQQQRVWTALNCVM